MPNVLYVSYTGMMEPLGASQVLAYLRRLAPSHQIDLVSYEKPGDWTDAARRESARAEIASAGIRWHPMPYHGGLALASTSYDVARGLSVARRVVKERGVQIVHARSYIGAVFGLHLKRALGTRFLFDMRSFWPDERAEIGAWNRNGVPYRVFKRLERSFLSHADAVVSLTHAGVDEMMKMPFVNERDLDIEVISTCADLERFAPPPSPPSGPFTLGYVGNTGGWYRFEPVVEAFASVRERHPDARLLVVNRGQHDAVWAALDARGVPREAAEVAAVDFARVPDMVRRMHAAAFFLEPSYAKQASAPTRLAELLGCGVPCLVRGGVGDAGRIVREAGVGVVVDTTDPAEVRSGALRLVELSADPDVRRRCAETAREHFSLDAGVRDYDRLYHELAGS